MVTDASAALAKAAFSRSVDHLIGTYLSTKPSSAASLRIALMASKIACWFGVKNSPFNPTKTLPLAGLSTSELKTFSFLPSADCVATNLSLAKTSVVKTAPAKVKAKALANTIFFIFFSFYPLNRTGIFNVKLYHIFLFFACFY